ncbi:MAG: DUF4399 domain-containing protein [Longimicrobiales bacterium]|nr:DUF4399 domain-containing protein [Longimicrobiales bacterium]
MRSSIALLTLLLSACAPDADRAPAAGEPDAAASADAPSVVRIVSPAQGDTVAGPDVTITLDVSGVHIVPAGDTTPGTGHHHLYLDADLTPAGQPVPAVPGSIVHMGDASTRYTFTGVAPGEHRVVAVVGDGVHVPLQPWVVDTVVFVVR